MLLKQATLNAIRVGRVTLAYRRWARPRLKTGGKMLTAVGQLAVDGVDLVRRDDISESDARAAGFETREALFERLDRREGDIYRVQLRYLGDDPRIALRESIPDAKELANLIERLDRMDKRTEGGPWTRESLQLIHDHPETLAASLADKAGVDKAVFKPRVRRLKALGLTESLKVGYRLSPRGQAVLNRLNR